MNKVLLTAAITLIVLTVSVLLINGSYFDINAGVPNRITGPISSAKPGKTLKAFSSKAELDKFLRDFAKERERRQNYGLKDSESDSNSNAPMASKAASEESKADDSVTNNQHAGVDEGGIVKVHGNHLIVLRRGRLFTVAIGDGSLKPVSTIDAFPSDGDASGTWYDEMLVSRDTIAVIGYSYARGGTEIGLFNINDAGNLKYRDTYHLRSNDYYSSRNYASRLVDGKLIFYTPQYLWVDPNNPTAQFPALRKWRKGAKDDEFQNIVAATKVYRPAREMTNSYGLALHTVTVCDLNSDNFKCEGTGVIGPAGRVFYVSPQSVYVWTSDWQRNGDKQEMRSMLYKMPLDGGAPQALGVAGSPVDQFSFLESDDNHLNVLVRSEGGGEAMWRSEVSKGDTALLRIPVWSFSDGTKNASNWNYKPLPTAEGYTIQNRFIGDFLLYGSGNSWGRQTKGGSEIYAVRWATGETAELPLEHSVDRIEALGKDAVVVGTHGSDLYFSPVRLDKKPSVRNGYVRQNAAQGELRSHGFFYKPDGKDSGMLGLPIAEQGRPGYKHLVEGSASVLFVKNNSLKLDEIGTLASRNAKQPDDNCKASCVDWYGNARPLFIRGRIFALLGYEIVEGRISGTTIRETARTNFTPGKGKFARAGD